MIFRVSFHKSLSTHSVVKQLLQLLISVVDAELFKTVQLKNFKSCYIQNSNKTETKDGILMRSDKRAYLAPCLFVLSSDLLILVTIHLKSLS